MKTISEKLAKVNETFTVNMYDNGYMFEIGGRDSENEWRNVKLIVSSTKELFELITEATSMPKDD